MATWKDFDLSRVAKQEIKLNVQNKQFLLLSYENKNKTKWTIFFNSSYTAEV